jgi:hypothetical protein
MRLWLSCGAWLEDFGWADTGIRPYGQLNMALDL